MKFDTFLKVFDAVMSMRGPSRDNETATTSDTRISQSSPSGFAEQLELRLTNVVVAALKEAFDRDHQRLELERAHLEEQRRLAEEATRRELQRQVVDREIGRLRLLAGIALVGWIASVALLVSRLDHVSIASRVVLGAGWLLLLGSLFSSLSSQSRLSSGVLQDDRQAQPAPAGHLTLAFLIAGLGLSAVSLLL